VRCIEHHPRKGRARQECDKVRSLGGACHRRRDRGWRTVYGQGCGRRCHPSTSLAQLFSGYRSRRPEQGGKSPDGDLLGDCHALCPSANQYASATLPALPAMRISWNCCRPTLKLYKEDSTNCATAGCRIRFPSLAPLSIRITTPLEAPNGHAMFSVYSFAPYDIEKKGGQHWDSLRDVWPRQMFRDVQKWVDNFDAEHIIASKSYSPLDLERSSSSFVRGDIHGAAPFFHQMNGHRPTPDLAQYKVPRHRRLLFGGALHASGRRPHRCRARDRRCA